VTTQIRVFHGAGNGSSLWRADSTYLDGAERYQAQAKSVYAAPAGAGGECIFPAVYLTVTHEAGCTIRVTPFLDGVAQDSYDVEVAAVAEVVTEVYELAFVLRQADSMDPAVTVGATYLRGTFLAVKLVTLVEVDDALVPGAPQGLFILDGAELEYEVVRESRVAQ
jgi:hypothetical protein